MRNLKQIREEKKKEEQSVREIISYILKMNPQLAHGSYEEQKNTFSRQSVAELNHIRKELIIKSHEILDSMEW